MNQIVKYNYFNPENIKFLNKKQYDSIAKIGLCYHHTPTFKNYISFITPWMFVPFGMGRYENNLNDTKFYLDLSFAGINTDLYLQQFHNILDKIDKYIIYNIRNNLEHLELGHLLPKKNLAKVYTNSLRYNINKDTLEKDRRFPPTLKLKLFTTNLILTDKDGHKLHSYDHLRRGIYVKANIKCNGMWILKNKFGLTWTAKHIRVSYTKVENKE